MSCKCQGCGNQYRVDVEVHDALWERIKPEGKMSGAGLLCGSCIMARVEQSGCYETFYLTPNLKFETLSSVSYTKKNPNLKAPKK